jgi:superfamily II DNA or RNA helicase
VGIANLLRSYDGSVLARGRKYAAEGRVTGVRKDENAVHAFVHGTQRYEVTVSLADDEATCTCLAYAREGQCKHLAAVALTINGDAGEQPADPLPPVFRDVYSSSLFLDRLSLHAGRPLGDHVERWSTLSHWWQSSRGSKNADTIAIREAIAAHAPEIERDVETLRAWRPERNPLPGTVFGDLYESLARQYVRHAEWVQIRSCAPGPFDARHPGFEFWYDARHFLFEANERPAPLVKSRRRLAFAIPPPNRGEARFVDGALGGHGPADAWSMFALREILVAMHAKSDPAFEALAIELGRPMWDHILEGLSNPKASRPPEPREWAFSLAPTYYRQSYELAAYARKPGKKWKRQSFEAIYAEDGSPMEREIARIALASMERASSTRFVLGTAQAHELLRALSRHPNVRVVASESRPDPERDPHAEIIVGDLSMKLEHAPNGLLVPKFFAREKELPVTMLAESAGPMFRGVARGAMIASVFVPAPLRPWLAAAEKMGTAMTFPPEAVGKLAMTTEPLVASGVVELPREALGAELVNAPRPALRVEWHREGGAVVEVFIAVQEGAPLVAPGLGPTLFTYMHAGRRVFVERDLARERTIAEEARTRITVPLLWATETTARTDSFEDAIQLAEWLDRNPLDFPIEVTVGRAPSVTAWGDATRTLQVNNQGNWLVLDGALKVAGVKLTLGDVLDAARLARRYVKAADGVFLELSKEAIEKLQPVAIASELAEADDDAVRLHGAFGSILAEARGVFDVVRGVDLDAYVKRFESRAKNIATPRLEHGKLRKYQRDGVRWMLELATWAPGCVLADDMGLGKTVQTASVLLARKSLGPALIIAPASVSSNWLAELARFVPSLKVRWFNDSRELDDCDVLVVSYGLLQRRADLFASRKWATVVVDEAQYVKNVTALRTDAVRALERDFTIALTGTPLENHLGELYSITDLVFPGLLGGEPVFREKFRRPIEGARDETRLAVLGRLLSPFLLRRTRKGVLRELPPREEITDWIDLGPEEAKRYLALRRACEQQFAKRKREETAAQLRIALFAALTRLRQLACDVRLVDPTYVGASTKIARTVEIATELAQEGNRALVFSQFTQFLEKIRDALAAAGLRVAYLAGDTPTTKRKPIIDAFQRGEYDIFCVSLLAGGTGLNLTKASYVIHTDPWWNPAAEEQATSRAHRMGQTDPVTVYRLVSRGTIEEAVLQMHASKRELASAVLEGKANAKAITSAELLDLLRFGG